MPEQDRATTTGEVWERHSGTGSNPVSQGVELIGFDPVTTIIDFEPKVAAAGADYILVRHGAKDIVLLSRALQPRSNLRGAS